MEEEKWPQHEEWPEGLPEEEIKERGLGFRIIQVIFAIAVVVGLVYLSGLHQYFFFHKTSPTVEQEELESAIEAERISLPLNLFILRNDENNGSERSEENARKLVENASKIWEQAAINLELKKIYELERSDQAIEVLFDHPTTFTKNLEHFDSKIINIFLVEKLKGINGLSFAGLKTTIVADYTTEYDFRVLAHEIGHILGLDHTETKQKLMYQGANGTLLSISEIIEARQQAKNIIEKN